MTMTPIIYALLAVVIVLGALVGVQWMWLSSAKAALADEQKAHALTLATYQSAAAAATTDYRTIEHTLAAAREEAENVRLQERAAYDASLVRLSAYNDQLRVEIDTWADRGGGTPADAACPAVRTRAATLGRVLERYVRADAESAARLEAQASDIRALRAWADDAYRALSPH